MWDPMSHQSQQNMNAIFYATSYHPIQAGSIDGTDTAPHDNAVYRALLASSTGLYDPTGDQKAEGDPYNTLFVGRLARHTSEKTLQEAMSNYGRVKHLRLVRHIVTGASRGYAFVEFESKRDMQYAYEMAQHHIIDGSQILVDYNRQQLMLGWIPRRLGGGLGGHKESGQLRFGGRDRPFRAPLRTIPQEQLIKLGIPLPPVGRYMSRFQLPPAPRRPESFNEESHHRHKHSHKRGHLQETLPSENLGAEEWVEIEQWSSLSQQSETSSRLGRRSTESERLLSTHMEHRERQAKEGDVEENASHKHGWEKDKKQNKKRSRAEYDERATRFDPDDPVSNRGHDRTTSRSGHKDGETSHRQRRERGSTVEYDESPKHGRKDDKESLTKPRRRDD